jgi:2-aminoethylphosphonate-pyruvate transaminase
MDGDMNPKLLNPGPVTLTERVRQALLRPDLCHREPDFADLLRQVRERLLLVQPETVDRYEPILLGGSGTCAVEAMVSSFVPKGGRALVVVNGVYGERMAAMLDAQGKTYDMVASPWTEAPNLGEAARMLDAGVYDACLTVHHETTTGRLNDIAALAALCKAAGVPLLLDGVSSFGAEAIPFLTGPIAACAATANKCLHGVPGASFVLADPKLFDRPSGATSLYLDLYAYRETERKGYTPFTPPVHALYALDEALAEYQDLGGLSARHAAYARRMQRVRQGYAELGLTPMLADGETSVCLSSFHLPAGLTYQALHDGLREAGFVVYAGQGGLAAQIVRIAVMGDLADADIERLLAATGRIVGTRA